MNKFKENNYKKIIQIGAWMRDIDGILKIKLKLNNINKAVLIGKKMEGYYKNINLLISNNQTNIDDNIIVETNLNKINSISRDNKLRLEFNQDKCIEIITFLENDSYDILLSNNIVFLKLIDASAVNTIIECIVRSTPIVINKIKPVVEVLGENYPLFYNSVSDVEELVTIDNIEKAHVYLKKMDKTKFKIETFVKSFQNILNQIIIEKNSIII
jgi:hypothetical protein